MKQLLFLILSLSFALKSIGQHQSDSVKVHKEYQLGKLFRETPYVNDKKNGIEKQYFDKGGIEEETPYANGKKSGIGKRYIENGSIQAEEVYTNDKIIEEKVYYPSGKLEYLRTFDTIHIGGQTEKRYFEDGKLNYEGGQTDQIAWMNIYDENGKLIRHALDSIKNMKLAPISNGVHRN
jgi:antitoxin component YwqK of YwqJK toxin-antitoxin module